MASKLEVNGRISTIDVDSSGFCTVTVSVGESLTLFDRTIQGTLYIQVSPSELTEWQLGKRATITIDIGALS